MLDTIASRRTRRRAAALAAGAAGAAAAYYAYQWWYSDADEGAEKEQARNPWWPRPRGEGALPRAGVVPRSTARVLPPVVSPSDGTLDMASHFASIQRTLERGQVPALLQALGHLLQRLVDTQGLRTHATLFAGRSASAKVKEQKLAAFRALSEACCVLCVVTAWMAPLLSLLQRAQMNIMGRHLYLQTEVVADRLPEECLTAEAQGRYLHALDALPEGAIVAALGLVREAVHRALADQSLVDMGLRRPQLLDIMSTIHAEVERHVAGWAAEELPRSITTEADLAGGGVVAEMMLELRSLVSSPAFALALRDSAQAAAVIQMDSLMAHVGDAPCSLAKVAPLVERCGTLLLEDGARPMLEAVRSLPSVQRMAALAYAGGI